MPKFSRPNKFVALVIALALILGNPVALMAQSGGNCSIFRSWIPSLAIA